MEGYFEYCANCLRCHDYGRYVASLYLREEVRKVAFTLYAFDHELRQITCRVSDPMPGEIRIQWWRDAIVNGSDCAGAPLAQAMRKIITGYNFPLEIIEKLINAHSLNLYQGAVENRSVFENHLKDINSSLLCMLATVISGMEKKQINNSDNSHIKTACAHAGIFTGITGLIKALPLHTRFSRFYFPSELSDHRHIPERWLENQPKKIDDAWLEDIVKYAFTHYNFAADASSRLPVPFRRIFYGCVLVKTELEDIVKRGVSLDFSYRGFSPLKIHWLLWKMNRYSGWF